MIRVELGGWTLSCDPTRTRATYAAIAQGGCQICTCGNCRNYRNVVLTAFPAEVLAFFAATHIDPLKDAEVYEMGPAADGQRLYGGEYYFFGAIDVEGPSRSLIRKSPRFEADFFSAPTALAQPEFQVAGAIGFCFIAELPWVLPDSELSDMPAIAPPDPWQQ